MYFHFFDEKGKIQFVKYRKTDFDKSKDANKEWCEANCKPILFGMKQCEDFTTLVITEGQIDSLSVATAGIKKCCFSSYRCKWFYMATLLLGIG